MTWRGVGSVGEALLLISKLFPPLFILVCWPQDRVGVSSGCVYGTGTGRWHVEGVLLTGGEAGAGGGVVKGEVAVRSRCAWAACPRASSDWPSCRDLLADLVLCGRTCSRVARAGDAVGRTLNLQPNTQRAIKKRHSATIQWCCKQHSSFTAFAFADLANGRLQLAVARVAALLVSLQWRRRSVRRRVFAFTRFANSARKKSRKITDYRIEHIYRDGTLCITSRLTVLHR